MIYFDTTPAYVLRNARNADEIQRSGAFAMQIQSTNLSARSVRPLLRIGALSLACVLALGACKGNGEAEAKAAEEKVEAVPVETAAVSRRAVAASYTGTAPLEARAESQVVAKTSGVALQVMAEEGQQVRAGQVLVRLDAARASLQAMQTGAQLRKLEANYARSQALAKDKLVSMNDNEQLRFDVENARAANRLANLELGYANVVAPISGVIAQRMIKPGNFVQINTPIFRIVDTSQLEAVLNVPERELATLKAGLPVQLLVDAMPGRAFSGTVDRIAPVVDSGSGTFRVITRFEGGGTLQPGMFGRLRIDYDSRKNALVVPRVALLDDEGEPAVFAVRGSKVARVPVKLGYIDGEWAEVLTGLKSGDIVVTAGKTALRDGTLVQTLGDKKKAAVATAAAPAKR